MTGVRWRDLMLMEWGGKADIDVMGSTIATPAHISCAQQSPLGVWGQRRAHKHR